MATIMGKSVETPSSIEGKNQEIYSTLPVETPSSKLMTRVEQNNKSVIIQGERHMKLMELAFKNNSDIAVIERLVDIQNAFEEKEARKAFFSALSKFQSEIPVIKKKGDVAYNQTSYTFAKLEDIAKAIKPYLFVNGLSYRFEQSEEGLIITVTCIVTHIEGHSERSKMSSPPDNSGGKNPIQAKSSANSYLRRYTLTGCFGLTVSDEDDDGRASGNAPPQACQLYSNEAFDGNFSELEKRVISGSKTKAQIIDHFKKLKINLSPKQKNKIYNIQVPGQETDKEFLADLEDK